MSGLNAHDMVTRYKVNRSLNGHEIEHPLKLKKRRSEHLRYKPLLKRLNDSCAKSAGKHSAMPGFAGTASFVTQAI